ncbi:hypothetical protein [Brevundimonas sp. PWP3-1b1]|uniref:hypothetical protein n=1 Tax=unclassified Brevundimonas TaxID=2622653 RepID=UPI003CF700B5
MGLAAIVAAVSFMAATPSLALDLNDATTPISAAGEAEVARLTEPFFRSLKAADATKAYADLFKGTLLESKTVEVAQLATQTNFVLQTYGAVSSWELASSECMTDYICKLVYVVRLDKGPVAFWIYAYRQPTGVWQPTYVLLGDSPQFFFK